VTTGIVREVIRDIEGKPRVARRWRVRSSLAALFVMGAVLSVSAYRELLRPGLDTETGGPIASASSARPAVGLLQELPSLPPPGSDSRGAEAGRPVVNTTPLPTTEPPLVATRVVRQGDTLLRLTLDAYGFPLDEVLQRVLQQNPRISDVNWLQAGTTIRFPDVSDLQARKSRPTSQGQQGP
jgi:phage tail protein X